MAGRTIAITVLALLTAIGHDGMARADEQFVWVPKRESAVNEITHWEGLLDSFPPPLTSGGWFSAAPEFHPGTEDPRVPATAGRRQPSASHPVPTRLQPPVTGSSDPFVPLTLSNEYVLFSQEVGEPYPESPARPDSESPLPSVDRQLELLRQRIEEMDTARIAQEDATRTIISQAVATRGANITEFVVFGGTLESLAGWVEDFDGVGESDIVLDTAELDFEIAVNEWALGSVVFEYLDGADLIFPTVEGDEAFIDRMNVDTAFVTIGNTQRFCLFTTVGRVIVPFGISTGDPVADVLNIDSPLTVDAFETRQDVVLIGFEAPTPPPPPPLSPLVKVPPPPIVRPLLVAPFVYKLSRCLGYCPLPPIPPGEYIPPPPLPKIPPYNGAIYVYNGETTDGGENHIEQYGGTLGYRTKGRFPYELPIIAPVPGSPWSIDMDIDFNSSVFDSRFLQFEYRSFLDQIGFVPGVAAHTKSTLGPVSLVLEWNSAVNDATLVDDLGTPYSLTPSAWQVSLGYQFDWNPTVEIIGLQGTYLTVSYSETQDLAGVTRVIDGEDVRVGNLPQTRFLISLGEWVLDGTRVAVEYARITDYSQDDGGTGRSADAYFLQLTYEW